MTESSQIMEDGLNIYNQLSERYPSNEQIICVLEAAKTKALRNASIRDLENGLHLEDTDLEEKEKKN